MRGWSVRSATPSTRRTAARLRVRRAHPTNTRGGRASRTLAPQHPSSRHPAGRPGTPGTFRKGVTTMPTFSTPTPIEVSFALQAARLELVASDRRDTVVTVAPRNPSRAGDVTAVEQTSVTFADGRITIIGPRRWNLFGQTDSIVVTVELPNSSTVGGEVSYGNVRGTGR